MRAGFTSLRFQTSTLGKTTADTFQWEKETVAGVGLMSAVPDLSPCFVAASAADADLFSLAYSLHLQIR